MDLVQKGQEANIGGIKQCMVTLKWTTSTDFDLAAVYEGKDGKTGLVYFGELGDLNAFPLFNLVAMRVLEILAVTTKKI